MREADTFIAIHRRRPMHRIIEIISIDVSDRTRSKMAFLLDKITFVGFFESFFPIIHFILYRTGENERNLKVRIFILENSLFFYPKNTLFILFSILLSQRYIPFFKFLFSISILYRFARLSPYPLG